MADDKRAVTKAEMRRLREIADSAAINEAMALAAFEKAESEYEEAKKALDRVESNFKEANEFVKDPDLLPDLRKKLDEAGRIEAATDTSDEDRAKAQDEARELIAKIVCGERVLATGSTLISDLESLGKEIEALTEEKEKAKVDAESDLEDAKAAKEAADQALENADIAEFNIGNIWNNHRAGILSAVVVLVLLGILITGYMAAFGDKSTDEQQASSNTVAEQSQAAEKANEPLANRDFLTQSEAETLYNTKFEDGYKADFVSVKGERIVLGVAITRNRTAVYGIEGRGYRNFGAINVPFVTDADKVGTEAAQKLLDYWVKNRDTQ